MEEFEFKLRGKVIRMARNLKGVSIREFAEVTRIYHNTIARIEREERGISPLYEIRLLRGLKEIGLSDAQIWAMQKIVEHDEGRFEE